MEFPTETEATCWLPWCIFRASLYNFPSVSEEDRMNNNTVQGREHSRIPPDTTPKKPMVVDQKRKCLIFFKYVDMYLCMYVFSIVATPFNIKLCNFGITFRIWLSKT